MKDAIKKVFFAVFDFFSSKTRAQILSLGFFFLVLIAFIDISTFEMLSFSIFYLVPIFLVTWYAGRGAGFVFALLSGAIQMAQNIIVEQRWFSWVVPAWNTFSTFVFFCGFVFLLDFLRKRLNEQKSLALLDPLTDIANRRHLLAALQNEISRLERFKRPFSVALIDLDGLKKVNDTLGHTTGDELLKTVAMVLKNSLRGTDGVFRIGGDEFVILLSETGRDMVARIMTRLETRLKESMQEKRWPVSFSMGVTTVSEAAEDTEEILRKVDLLMYRAKKGGKNAIQYDFEIDAG